MSHEQSETVETENGTYINVYGRDSDVGKAVHPDVKRLPEDDSGVGHKEYDTLDEAVKEAKQRSDYHGEHHPEHSIRFNEQEKPTASRALSNVSGKKVPNPRPVRMTPGTGGVRG